MDVQTIDRNYAELQAESQDTITAITALAQKLQAAGEGGDTNAREWILDLKEIAINLRDEQTKVAALLQSLHDFVVNELDSSGQAPDYPPPSPQYQQPGYQDPNYQQGNQYQQGGYGRSGGMLQHFRGGGFGQAIAMGAGFGLGDDLIRRMF